MIIVGQTPTLDTNAYSAGDACGGLLTFDLGKVGARTVLLKRAELLDDASSPDSADMDLHLFTDATMVVADDAAFTVSAANFLAGKYLGKINFATYAATVVGTEANAVLAIQNNIDRLIPLQQGKVYGQLVCTATPTFAAAQLTVLLHFAEYA
jgi:hypothetical protein